VSRIRLYLDEDTINASLVKALRNANLDVDTVADAQRLGLSDEEQLMWAVNQGRVLYSYNVGDFCQLHSSFIVDERNHAGIILASQRQYSIGQQQRGLLKLAASLSAEEMVNQLLFLSAYVAKNDSLGAG
jgi:Domain of unknown function (DUF5615)